LDLLLLLFDKPSPNSPPLPHLLALVVVVGSGLRVRFRRHHFQRREPKRQPRAAAQARLHVPVAVQELALGDASSQSAPIGERVAAASRHEPERCRQRRVLGHRYGAVRRPRKRRTVFFLRLAFAGA
jgi:hypothetical protein